MQPEELITEPVAERRFHTMGAIQTERDRLSKKPGCSEEHLPPFPEPRPCPVSTCKDGRVPHHRTTKVCEVCDGTSQIPGFPLNRADVRRIAKGFPRVFRKRVFGRIHQVHRPQRGTTAHA